MNQPERFELAELLKPALGDRATELLMAELPDPDDEHTHDDLVAGIEGLRAQMDQQFASIRDQFADIDRRFELVDQRFEQVDQRFEQVEQRLAVVDTRLAGVDTSLQVLTERIDTNYYRTEALVLREMGTMRADLITQTRTLFIGIPSMVGAMAVFVLGLAQFTLGR